MRRSAVALLGTVLVLGGCKTLTQKIAGVVVVTGAVGAAAVGGGAALIGKSGRKDEEPRAADTRDPAGDRDLERRWRDVKRRYEDR